MQHRGEASRYGFQGRSGSVFDKQRAYFATDATKTYEWRIDQLDRLSRMLKENESPLPGGCRDPQYRADAVLRSARIAEEARLPRRDQRRYRGRTHYVSDLKELFGIVFSTNHRIFGLQRTATPQPNRVVSIDMDQIVLF
jgi:hypothetical protein